jgi:hypothetical protein
MRTAANVLSLAVSHFDTIDSTGCLHSTAVPLAASSPVALVLPKAKLRTLLLLPLLLLLLLQVWQLTKATLPQCRANCTKIPLPTSCYQQ